jgi:hypothetical protein
MKPCLLIIFFSLSLPIYAQNPQKIYEFHLGKYHILDFPVNIRSQPGLTGSVIGKLELDSEVEIVENTKVSQAIGNKTHYWYKIKYGNITGYIWGGLIAVEAGTFNIDGNKILVYSRCSYTEGRIGNDGTYYFYYDMVLPDDIFIYINQKPINIYDTIKRVYLEEFFIDYSTGNEVEHAVGKFWNYCDFYKGETFYNSADRRYFEKDNIVIRIHDRAIAYSVFVIDKYGKITWKYNEIANTN